jgi:hypothetical protein
MVVILASDISQVSKGLIRMNDIWTKLGVFFGHALADYHYSYAEGDLVYAVSDFTVRYDRWMMLSSFPGP